MEQQNQKSTSLNNHKAGEKEENEKTSPVRTNTALVYRRFAENYD